MTTDRVPVDDLDVLRRILTGADALLLDFDGPACSVFAGIPAHLVADHLRTVLAESGHTELPAEADKTDDPFDVLRYAATLDGNEADYVEAALRAHEVEAVASATPTPGAHNLIQAWHATGRKLAIVSNNSTAAIETYLHLHELAACVDHVSARTNSDTSRLKPSPFLIQRAVEHLKTAPARCVLIGDSPTDIQAAHAARTPVIGYANKPGKEAALASADMLISTMRIATQW